MERINVEKSLKIGIFIGKGASYSWIWFVKTFDLLDFNDIYFLDESDVLSGELAHYDCFVLPGGDPFQVADGLGEEGLLQVKSCVEGGGTYLGVCAGTYLAITFCDNPMPWLNLVDIPIKNYALDPPEAVRMKYKYLVPYRDGFVYHPVRGSLEVSTGDEAFKAPLYGGPPMLAPQDIRLLDYSGFDEKTLYLIEEERAEKTMLGYAAGVKVPVGAGMLYLFGPHFEHPHYPRANQFLYDILKTVTPQADGPAGTATTLLEGDALKRWIKSLRREVSSSRVLANGLTDLRWKIGEKVWEDEKILYFITELLKLLKDLQKYEMLPVADPASLERDAKSIHSLLAEIRVRSMDGQETNQQASVLIESTKSLSKGLFEAYFRFKRNDWWSNGEDCRTHN